MTVGDLIKKLEKYDSELQVYVPCTIGEFDFHVAHTVEIKHLSIEDSEEYPDQTMVVVIDEV